MSSIQIAIIHYPNALRSAIYGLEEMFQLANRLCEEQQLDIRFNAKIFTTETLESLAQHVVILPPSHSSSEEMSSYSTPEIDSYLNPSKSFITWLDEQHRQGAVLSSACAGAFILSATQSLNGRAITTHWGLEQALKQQFPDQLLDTNQLLIDHGDILSAGGMMSWLDLGFELIAKLASPAIMRQLGKILVVDTAPREQRYYLQFVPPMQHGDIAVLEIQNRMNLNYHQPLSIAELAHQAHLTERTLQRRFSKATGDTPNQYLQKLRTQKACDLLESTTHSFEHIAHLVGYQDSAACRKVFIKIMGLTPRAFRQRFTRS
ncbi:GlxA family transcriptional regulator [Vibrio sp. LaRot3]|uniref:GlxA family transcriptional regulator n=1 Tax=Vibrio sp. LaRot3 TaxID=2998829 RepID=UPI0022CE09C8|nr:helix-turn-helix domain-containing protein [Vibrio sp. LaRot3]MDA0149889.1 helix-turn-helix domain-containing protein [Vibrio sp. LaRot3]